mgnify:CR=1 FL=1
MNKHNQSKSVLLEAFKVAVQAADPMKCVPPCIPPSPKGGKLVVVGAGKASGAMARAVENHVAGPLKGIVITPYGHSVYCKDIEVIEAAHPVPDENGFLATKKIMGLVKQLNNKDLLLCLISGGGSALLTMPAYGISLSDKQFINSALLRSGATISEINCVRKHLSAIKGGRLATLAFPARVTSLLISDVPGDDPSIIASGPTIGDDTTFEDARIILEKYNIDAPETIKSVIYSAEDETPRCNDSRLEQNVVKLVASPQASLEAAAKYVEKSGYTAIILGDKIEGVASNVGREHGALAKAIKVQKKPIALISGGETTVVVTGSGRGGRNTEYLLAMALEINGVTGISAIACDTDGIDGMEKNAGAIIDSQTLKRAIKVGVDPFRALSENDAFSFFDSIDDLVICGPTFTNVNDFRMILIDAQ